MRGSYAAWTALFKELCDDEDKNRAHFAIR